MVSKPGHGLDRRAALRRIAAAGAVAWSTPVILTKPPVAAGVFTTKCAPSTVTGTTVSTIWQTCTTSVSRVRVTLSFSGSCPCGGTPTFCISKTSPTTPAGTISNSGNTIVFDVNVPFPSSAAASGQVAMRCIDRDGDIQWARYNWSMVVTDAGTSCNTAFSGSTPALTGRTLFTQTACPVTAALAARSSPDAGPSAPVGRSLD